MVQEIYRVDTFPRRLGDKIFKLIRKSNSRPITGFLVIAIDDEGRPGMFGMCGGQGDHEPHEMDNEEMRYLIQQLAVEETCEHNRAIGFCPECKADAKPGEGGYV